ncbi:MAG: hypothetical protein EA397_19685 [Deltaproteobacteria bacterium]|nr:MAG: hypothetical protein EA397_19685 [Deltaproteobacteria bacterium]
MKKLTLVFVFSLGLTGRASAKDQRLVQLCFQDPSGEIVRTASFIHAENQERLRVNVETGCLSFQTIFISDGREDLLMSPGAVFRGTYAAPGYSMGQVELTVHRKKRKNDHVLTLAPLNVPIPAGRPTSIEHSADEYADQAWSALEKGDYDQVDRAARRAIERSANDLEGDDLHARVMALHDVMMVAAYRNWKHLSEKLTGGPYFDTLAVERSRARQHLRRMAEARLKAGRVEAYDSELALELCKVSASQPDRCQ